jgi:uncharacterized membrane protein
MDTLLPGLKSAINLHPMIVHFPIVFWVSATAMWSYSQIRASSGAWRSGLWLHTAGAVAALAAVAAGYLGTSLMGHDSPGHAQVHVHRDIMLWATGLSLLVTGLAWWRSHSARIGRLPLLLLSILQVGVMTIGADRGAVLVYQLGVGVDGTPSSDSESHESHQ